MLELLYKRYPIEISAPQMVVGLSIGQLWSGSRGSLGRSVWHVLLRETQQHMMHRQDNI